MWTAEPLQRDHVEALALEPPHDFAAPFLGRPRGAVGFGHDWLRSQHRMPVAEERVAVRHALVRAAGDPQNSLAAPDVLERERQAVDGDAVAARDELLRLLGVTLRIGPAGEPPAVVAPFGGTERRVGEHVLLADILTATEGLEHCAARKLVRPVAEHRPVRDLARRRAPGANRIEDAARSGRAEPVEVRRCRGLDPAAPAKRFVRTVGEPVQQEDDDRKHAASLAT